MKISPRNRITGKEVKIVSSKVIAEIMVELPGGTQLISIITNNSVDHLDLRGGKEAYAIINASNVMAGID